jgi:hypothetical protein
MIAKLRGWHQAGPQQETAQADLYMRALFGTFYGSVAGAAAAQGLAWNRLCREAAPKRLLDFGRRSSPGGASQQAPTTLLTDPRAGALTKLVFRLSQAVIARGEPERIRVPCTITINWNTLPNQQ